MEILKRFAAKLAFAIANGVIRILYPPKVTWEDKKAAKSKEETVVPGLFKISCAFVLSFLFIIA